MTIWADLEPRTAGTGALRLIPGSHLPEFERQLCEYRAAEHAISGFGHWEWPHVVVETEPGDVVADKRGATRLGFALLLKFYTRSGRFPRGEIKLDMKSRLAPGVPRTVGGG